MRESWIIVGAGSAGCVLANRLSADAERTVTLIETGPTLASGAVPAGIAGPNFFAAMHEPDRMFPELLATRAVGIEPTVYQRGRGVGGSSAVNAMVALRGSDSLYRSWDWHDVDAAWALVAVPTDMPDLSALGAVDQALLRDPRAERLNLTRQGGERITSAHAYLWPIVDRPNLQLRADTTVDRISFDDRRATGVVLDDGTVLDADNVVVCGGAIHSPAILLRSGVDTPGVGHGLQDHPSVVFTLALREQVEHDSTGLALGSALHTMIDDDLIQLLPMSHVGADPDTVGLGALMAALMTPTGRAGTVAIDAAGSPMIDFALLDDDHDLGLIAAARLALDVLDTDPFHDIVEQVYIDDLGTTADTLTDGAAIDAWVRSHCGDYVHATSSCAMGTVVDADFAVAGYHGLFVCDASVFPSIPDANTHFPTTMLAERFGLRHC